MKVHIGMFISGVVDVTIISPTDIKAELLMVTDHASTYVDDGMSGKMMVSPTILSMIQLTAGQVVTDAMRQKIEAALAESTKDITLQMTSTGGDA